MSNSTGSSISSASSDAGSGSFGDTVSGTNQFINCYLLTYLDNKRNESTIAVDDTLDYNMKSDMMKSGIEIGI